MRSWDALRHLEAFARLGTAGAAGRELGVAASTVYRQIALLERELGVRCLERGKGVTEVARELVAVAQSTDASLHQISQRAKAVRADVRGTITLTTIDGFAPLLAAPLAELAVECPRLRVDVHVSDGGLSLRRKQAELGLALLATPPASLVGRKLFPVRWGVYARRGHDEGTATRRWVVLGAPLHTSWLGKWEAQHAPRDRIVAASASRRLLVDMVAGGVGVGLLPVPLAEGHPDLVELAHYRARTTSLTRTAWLLYSPDLRSDARIAAAARILGRHLARPS